MTYTPPGASQTRETGLAAPGLTMAEMPAELILATLLCEDREFHQHYGFRPGKISKALTHWWDKGTPVRGISTLTQQLAKNLFTGNERSFYRKFVELVYALKMERYFTKEEIFTLYINMAQTGDGLYGYREAAEHYFGKTVSELTLAESAFIVTLLPSPVAYSQPFEQKNINAATIARLRFAISQTHMIMREFFPDGINTEQKTRFISLLKGRGIFLTMRRADALSLQNAEPLIEEFRRRYALP